MQYQKTDSDRKVSTPSFTEQKDVEPYQGDLDVFKFLAKKSERIAAASYMLSDFLSESEPLRASIRVASSELVVALAGIGSVSVSEGRIESLVRASSILARLESLFEVTRYLGYVSEMNFALMKKELASFRSMVDSDSVRHSVQGVALPSRFLEEVQMTEKQRDEFQYKGQKRNTESVGTEDRQRLHPEQEESGFVKKPLERTSAQKDTDKRHSVSKGKTRSQEIVNVIEEKGDVSIKDISKEIAGCSEKTIQRELIALVQKGVLNKKGERRWSRYSIR